MSDSLLRSSIPQASDLFLKFLFSIFQGKLPRLESFPNCGRVGNKEHVECIWDCEWVDNPRYGQESNTGSVQIDELTANLSLTYRLIKYPPDTSCLDDCTFVAKLKARENSIAELLELATETLSQRPNIDSIILEICILYFELALPPCFNKPFPRNLERGSNLERLVGNSLTNNYVDPTLNYTLNQYPWTCSLRTSGYRGRHICGATLLSAPPSKTIIVGAAHCNYICKSSEGTVRETCCCRDTDDNFASCTTVIKI